MPLQPPPPSPPLTRRNLPSAHINMYLFQVGADVSRQMVNYANSTYGNSKMVFKILDIENADECSVYAGRLDKIFSFYCLHWVRHKYDALVNMHRMLKFRGEILVQCLLANPVVELYKLMAAEWQKYVQVRHTPIEMIYIYWIDSIDQNIHIILL